MTGDPHPSTAAVGTESDSTSAGRRPVRRICRQWHRTDSTCDGKEWLDARARRRATIAQTNLTKYTLAQTVHAAAITAVDVHHVSGTDKTALAELVATASGCVAFVPSHENAGRTRMSSSAAQHTM